MVKAKFGNHLLDMTLNSNQSDAAALCVCVAGVALGDIHLRFTWQAWHLVTSTFVLRGERGTYGTGLALVPCLGWDWPPVTPRHFAWQAWHLATSTFVSRGRRGTWRHLPSYCVAGVALVALGWLWWLWWLAPLCHTQLCDTSSLTHHFVTHNLSHTIFDTASFTHHLCNTPSFTHHLSHTILYTQLCHTPSFTHHLSHTTLSQTVFHHTIFSHITLSHAIFHHTIFRTQLGHRPSFATPSFTHHFVTHHLSHTTLSHTIFHT